MQVRFVPGVAISSSPHLWWQTRSHVLHNVLWYETSTSCNVVISWFSVYCLYFSTSTSAFFFENCMVQLINMTFHDMVRHGDHLHCCRYEQRISMSCWV